MTPSIRTRCLCTTFAMVTVFRCAAPAAAQTLAPLAAPQPSRAFAGLFRDTATDFRHLASKESITVLAVGGLMAAAAHGMDRPATATLSGTGGDLFAAGETLGSARVQIGSALATLAIGRLTGSPRLTAVGADLVRANILAQALTTGTKLSVRRGRPDGTQFSFPSGHTSVTFAAATVVQRHFGWKAGAPAYAVASYVAASRVHDKRHFLSDVTFGAAVGIVSGWSATMGHGRAQMSVAPMAAPGGGGVSVTWTGR
jgi:membrane-associated phospholipid phosphatase